MKHNIQRTPEGIALYTPADFAAMREACQLAAQTLDYITPYVTIGTTTDELNTLCHDYITKHGAIPAPLNYNGFPKSICTSINEVVCHGIPENRPLKNGDLMNIDVTVILNGWYGDTSRMYWVGDMSIKAKRLTDITYRCLMAGIDAAKPGNTLGDIGHAIQTIAEGQHCSVVRDFCGHGVGRVFHEAPSVLHYGKPGTGTVLEEGMIFTIEPMINLGKWQTRILADDWTAITKDRSLSAQFEHCIGITQDGCEIFTLSPKGLHFPPYAAD